MRSLLPLSLGLAVTACQTPHAHHHAFDDATAWAARFDDPARDAWQKPDEVVASLGLSPDMTVADVGSATGYFSVRFARAVPRGHVYGVDIESSMVDYLNQRAEREQLPNLSSLLGTLDDAKLPQPVDRIVIVDTYHHLDQRQAYFTKLAASLKPGGKLAIIDYTVASAMGPPPEAKVPPQQVERELSAAGWKLERSFDFLPEQFFLVFTR